MIRDSSRRRRVINNLLVLAFILSFVGWLGTRDRTPESEDTSGEDRSAIERELEPPAGVAGSREGIAAVVLMDVSGSMGDPVQEPGGQRTRIQIARQAALGLVGQFDAYAKAHPAELVLLGLLEFSERPPSSTRDVIPLSVPDPTRAEAALARMQPGGGTPIGDAIIAGKHALDRAGLSRRHLLVVTDGANTDGYEPADVLRALSRRPELERPSVYFVAFDIEASRFNSVRDAGGLVLAAANAEDLNNTLNSLLTGKILVEGP